MNQHRPMQASTWGHLAPVILTLLILSRLGSTTAQDPSVPAGQAGPIHMHFATVSTEGASVSRQSVMLVGQPMVGLISNAEYKMRVGAIEALLAPRPGDFDRDRFFDIDDWARLVECLAGPVQSTSSACRTADANHDENIDLRDLSYLLNVFSGLR